MTDPVTVRSTLFSPQQVAAYIRAVYSALITFAGTALISHSTLHVSWEDAFVSAGIAALFILGFRGVAEGSYDRGRAIDGDVKPSDVGAYDQPLKK